MEDIKANATYALAGTDVALRIGTGGSGQSGLLQALAEAFIKYRCDKDSVPPFLIEWYTSDTTVSINLLRREIVDLGITYHSIAEQAALEDGIVDRVEYAWRDHWMLVGPKSNPASLPTDGKASIYVLMMKLFSTMETRASEVRSGSGDLIKFLSRYDASAGNITESSIWTTIGHTPWAKPSAAWYHMLGDFPFQAIRQAAVLNEYTLTDYGTWCAIESETRDKLTVFALGTSDENDPLLNAAHVLVGTNAKNKVVANQFVDWMILKDGGQKVIADFKKNGKVLYDTIPEGVDPLARAINILGGGTKPRRVAAVPVTGSADTYFFQGAQYIRFDLATDTLAPYTYPKVNWELWKAFKYVGFESLDAILQLHEGGPDAYYFSGPRVAEMSNATIQQDSVAFITDKWSSLKTLGFDTIDAVMPETYLNPSENTSTWFFKGKKCARINLKTDVVDYELREVSTAFKGVLGKAGFETIDVCIPKKGTGYHQFYMFSGSQYVLYNLETEQVLVGPKEVADTWTCLKKAGFY